MTLYHAFAFGILLTHLNFPTSAAFYVQDPALHEEEALRTIGEALAHGVNLLDTACN